MKFVKWTALLTLGLIVITIVAVGSLWVATDGDYSVPPTVTTDASLPAMEIAGNRLHAETFGNPANPIIVVLHGGPGGDYQSLLGLRALSDQYRIVFYDQRGAGLSQRVTPDMLKIDDYVSELDALINTLATNNKLTLIGHSWGAILAAAYTAQHPDRVNTAILMEPGYLDADGRDQWATRSGEIMSGMEFFKLSLTTGFQAQHLDGPDAAASDDFLIGNMAHAFANHADNPYHCPGEGYDAPYWRFGAAANSAAAKFSSKRLDAISDGISKVSTPVLIMASACNDWIGSPLQLRHQRLFQNAELTVIDSAGHELVWDNPDATVLAIRKFLATH